MNTGLLEREMAVIGDYKPHYRLYTDSSIGAYSDFESAEKDAEVYNEGYVITIIDTYGKELIVADKHADDRDRKNWKKKYGMKVSNRSIKSIIFSYMKKGKKK